MPTILVADTHDDRGACADELGHALVAERLSTTAASLATYINIDPAFPGRLRSAGTTFPDKDAAKIVLALEHQGLVLSDLTGMCKVDMSRCHVPDVIVDPPELMAHCLIRARIASAGPIARSIVKGDPPLHPLARAARDGYRFFSTGEIWLNDAVRALSLLFFVFAPSNVLKPHAKADYWDFIAPMFDEISHNEPLRSTLCCEAAKAGSEVAAILGAGPDLTTCTDYLFALSNTACIYVLVEKMLSDCAVALSEHRASYLITGELP